jgi:hypothetical protein
MKMIGIPPKAHGFLDYAYAPLVWFAPQLGGFENDKTAVTLCRIISLATIGYSLFTNYKLGAVKKIPYKTHATIDIVAGAFNLASPWILKRQKQKATRNALLMMGLTSVIAGLFSLSYKED